MAHEGKASNYEGRLEDYISLALAGKTDHLQTKLYRKWFKEVRQSNATDDMDIEIDQCLLMVDFIPTQFGPGVPEKVTKAYMICPINQIEIDDNITRHIANERLRMDYARLKEAGISFEENYF